MIDDKTLEAMKGSGLFVAPLVNGDWMVGRGSLIYGRIDICTDHYKDPRLAVAKTIEEAVKKWIESTHPDKMKLTL